MGVCDMIVYRGESFFVFGYDDNWRGIFNEKKNHFSYPPTLLTGRSAIFRGNRRGLSGSVWDGRMGTDI